MRGPKPAYPIALTTEEAEQLQHLIRAHTTPQALAVRARIIVRANGLFAKLVSYFKWLVSAFDTNLCVEN